MFKCLSSDDNRDRWSSSLRDRTLQAPTRRDRLRLTQGDRRLVDNTTAPPWDTLSQYDPGRLRHGLTPIIKEWGSFLKTLPKSRHSVSCPFEGQLHRRCSLRVGFQFSLHFSCVLRSEGFYGGRSANPAMNLLKKSNPTARRHRQT